jgi:ATP-dependent helicase/nuclease subunit A
MARSPETSVDWPELRATLNDRRLRATEPSYVVSRISGGVDGEAVEVGRAEGRGRDYGTVIHQLFEDAVNRRMPPDPSYVDAFVREAGLSEESTVDALGALDRLRESDLWQELRRADRIFTEVPLGLPGIRRGVIDLIYRLDGRWKIVDFKTDAAPTLTDVDRLRVKYDLQVRAYANCWGEATGEPVEEFSVYFVHGPDAVHQLCLF